MAVQISVTRDREGSTFATVTDDGCELWTSQGAADILDAVWDLAEQLADRCLERGNIMGRFDRIEKYLEEGNEGLALAACRNAIDDANVELDATFDDVPVAP